MGNAYLSPSFLAYRSKDPYVPYGKPRLSHHAVKFSCSVQVAVIAFHRLHKMRYARILHAALADPFMQRNDIAAVRPFEIKIPMRGTSQ